MNSIMIALLWLAAPVCPDGGRPPCPEYPEPTIEVEQLWAHCPCCQQCEPTPCDSCCLEPECQEQDGQNHRYCDERWLGEEYGYGHKVADRLNSFYTILDGEDVAIHIWIDYDDYDAGLPPVLTWYPPSSERPWNVGIGNYPPIAAFGLVGKILIKEDFWYAIPASYLDDEPESWVYRGSAILEAYAE